MTKFMFKFISEIDKSMANILKFLTLFSFCSHENVGRQAGIRKMVVRIANSLI